MKHPSPVLVAAKDTISTYTYTYSIFGCSYFFISLIFYHEKKIVSIQHLDPDIKHRAYLNQEQGAGFGSESLYQNYIFQNKYNFFIMFFFLECSLLSTVLVVARKEALTG